jgi:WS/DGAT/MGAT family acyltransferase
MTIEHEPMAPVDAAWLRMDSESHAMVITVALVFDRPLELAAIRTMVEERLLVHRRFRQRANLGGALSAPRWEDDAVFDVRNHVRPAALPGDADLDALRAYVSDRLSEPLPRDRPLFCVDVIERMGARGALVVRLHHAIADGLALVGVLLGLIDETGGAPPPAAVGLPPAEVDEHLIERLRHAVDSARSLRKLLMIPHDHPSPLAGALGARKEAAFSRAIPLARIKKLARAANAKVNDVLSAAVAGALRAHLEARGALSSTDHTASMRAMVPVFLHGAHDDELGNHFGLVFLDLPIGAPDPRRRLELVKARMDAIKASPDASVAFRVLGAMGVAAAEIERIAIDVFSRKATLLITNVPAPPMRVHLAGALLEDLLVWAPQAGHVGLGVTLVTYGGELRMTVCVDARLLPNPRVLVDAFERELDALEAAL